MSSHDMTDKTEKNIDVTIVASPCLDDRDEALKLVGLERVGSFTDEQYRRVRMKLVSL